MLRVNLIVLTQVLSRFLRRLLLNHLTLYPVMWLCRTPALRRRALAYMYLRGQGLEIGALHNPMSVAAGVQVRYLDRKSEAGLRDEYRQHGDTPKVPIDSVDDAEELPSIGDDSQNFVIASHIIEHMENPLLALRHWLRVLKPGGILYLAVPNREHTFDHARPVTEFSHLLQDLRNGPESSRASHYQEWLRIVGKKSEQQIQRQLPVMMNKRTSIHFHVWDPIRFLELLQRCRQELSQPLEVLVFEVIGNEMLVVCRKTVQPEKFK